MENLNSIDFKDLKVPFLGTLFLVYKVFDDGREDSLFVAEREDLAQFFCNKSNTVRESTNFVFQYRPIDCVLY